MLRQRLPQCLEKTQRRGGKYKEFVQTLSTKTTGTGQVLETKGEKKVAIFGDGNKGLAGGAKGGVLRSRKRVHGVTRTARSRKNTDRTRGGLKELKRKV